MKHVFLALALMAPDFAMADVLDRIRGDGVVHLGVRTDAPPFAYNTKEGHAAGLAVRLCTEAMSRWSAMEGVALRIEYVPVDAQSRFEALASGRTDLHCGPASATLTRRETMDFSLLYFVDGVGAAVKPGAFERVFAEKAGRFGYLAGTTAGPVVADLAQRNGLAAEITEYASHAEGLRALEAGQLDVYFGDQAILMFQITDLGFAGKLEVMEEIFSFEPYALVMKRGESALRLAVDRALSQIYADGTIWEFIQQELGDYPLPPEAEAVYQIVGLPD